MSKRIAAIVSSVALGALLPLASPASAQQGPIDRIPIIQPPAPAPTPTPTPVTPTPTPTPAPGTSSTSPSVGATQAPRVPTTAEEQRNIKLDPMPPSEARRGPLLLPLPAVRADRLAAVESVTGTRVVSAIDAEREARALERELANPATKPGARSALALRLEGLRLLLAADQTDRLAAGPLSLR